MQAGGQEFDPPQLHQIPMFEGSLLEGGRPLFFGMTIFEQCRLRSLDESPGTESAGSIRPRAAPVETGGWMFDNEIDWVNKLQG